MPEVMIPPADVALPGAIGMVKAERAAVCALAEYMMTPEGQAADDPTLEEWVTSRGWPIGKLRRWSEMIAALTSLADPAATDPRVLVGRLDSRLERLAHRAEGNNDLKHAIEATEAQAKLHKLGGFSPAAQSSVALQFNIANAPLLSDADLEKIAMKAVAVDA